MLKTSLNDCELEVVIMLQSEGPQVCCSTSASGQNQFSEVLFPLRCLTWLLFLGMQLG